MLLNIVPTKKWSKEWSYIIAVLRLTKKYCKIVLNDIAKICREITKKKTVKGEIREDRYSLFWYLDQIIAWKQKNPGPGAHSSHGMIVFTNSRLTQEQSNWFVLFSCAWFSSSFVNLCESCEASKLTLYIVIMHIKIIYTHIFVHILQPVLIMNHVWPSNRKMSALCTVGIIAKL